MATDATIPVFDGHNDTLLSLPETGRSFFERSEKGHIDLPRAREGNLAGGFFAVFVPDPDQHAVSSTASSGAEVVADPTGSSYGSYDRMPPQMGIEYAQATALAMIADFHRIVRESDGEVRQVTTAAGIRECIEHGIFAAELHMEGAEAIDPDFNALEVYYAAGLRSLGITWSRANRFAHGVPFAFPASPDTGPGLTDLGKELVRQCNELGVLIDLSHLNEAGFWDVAKLSNAPLVASHSNVHAIAPSTRNLTERQLAAIRDSDGLVGVNFHVGFLRPDGERGSDISLDIMVDHIDALVSALGEDRVGLGSDFDGAKMPDAIGDAAGLPVLIAALKNRGYGEAMIRKIAYQNWIRVLELTWGE